jgi:hypothetical protein
MPVNAFAVATTVGVVVGGPALFCVLIGKNPLPSTSMSTQAAAEPVLPAYIPAKPAPAIVQQTPEESQPIQLVGGDTARPAPVVVQQPPDQAQPVQVVDAGSADESQPVQVVDAGSADKSQPVQVVDAGSLLKRSPFDDFEVRIPVSEDQPAYTPKRSATKPTPVVTRPTPVYSSSYWPTTNIRSPWNSIKAGANASRQGMSSSPFGSGQRLNPLTSRFTRVNQRSYFRKWYQ